MVHAFTYRHLPALALCFACGCTTFPQLEAQLSAADRAAAYPTLQPLAPLLAKAGSFEDRDAQNAQILETINARIARLNAKAARLRGPVVDQVTRNRMRRGVAVPASIR